MSAERKRRRGKIYNERGYHVRDDPLCFDCGVKVFAIREYCYMILDKLWIIYGVNDSLLCIVCLEKRIGRQLTRTDFKDCDLTHHKMFKRSKLLNSRLKVLTEPIIKEIIEEEVEIIEEEVEILIEEEVEILIEEIIEEEVEILIEETNSEEVEILIEETNSD